MKVSDLRGILQYVPRFREKIFVVAIDGDVVASANFQNILLDLAVLRSLNVKVILVHGASWQIRELATERGVTLSNSDGIGVTDDATLKVSLDAATNVLNDIMQGLTSTDLRAVYANAIVAHPAGILGGIDQQHTGRVERIDRKSLHLFLNDGIIPVIPPLGYDGEGRTFRVNSDGIALEVAAAMDAIKILFLTVPDGFTFGADLPRQLSMAEADDIVKKRKTSVPARLLSKIEHAARACRDGVARVHLLDGRLDEALLTEVFSTEGIGTMIYSNEYQQIRRIYKKDVRGVMSLIRQSVADEELVKRTRADILAHLEEYYVLEIDRNLVGCVAVHLHPEQQMAELACLYVARAHEGQGHGRKLVAFAEHQAAERGMKRMFALSTRTFNFFQKKSSYLEGTPDDLPPERRKKYDASARNSKVMVKDLAPAGALEPARL
jgi:amino-acid N-acetyltransferase